MGHIGKTALVLGGGNAPGAKLAGGYVPKRLSDAF